MTERRRKQVLGQSWALVLTQLLWRSRAQVLMITALAPLVLRQIILLPSRILATLWRQLFPEQD